MPGNDNANSLTLEIERDDRRILLTGDLEGAGMRRVLSRPPRDELVLTAPHHGSATTTRANSPLGLIPAM
ncbi:MAG: hypothetical protein QM811_10865 [Pirellulales bacterium]